MSYGKKQPKLDAKKALFHLRRGHKALTTNGWCQGQPQNAAGQVCLIGALWPIQEGWSDARDYLWNALSAAEQDEWSLVGWNDAKGRTAAEVIDLYDRAIAQAEADLEAA